jgi:DNA-binding transcriptional MerR regulator
MRGGVEPQWTNKNTSSPVKSLEPKPNESKSHEPKSHEPKSADAFRTISEVAEDLDIPQHVLRFWETRFSHIKPLKRGGGRRYYRPDDIELLKSIRYLLYGEGYTIKGVQRILKEEGVKAVQNMWRTTASHTTSTRPPTYHPRPHEDEQEMGEQEISGQDFDDHAHDGHESTIPLASQRQMPQKQTLQVKQATSSIAALAPKEMTLSRSDRETLKAAYLELVECRRILAELHA